jgi:hypothetical protein
MLLDAGSLANNWQIERAEAFDWRAAGLPSPHLNCPMEDAVIGLWPHCSVGRIHYPS